MEIWGIVHEFGEMLAQCAAVPEGQEGETGSLTGWSKLWSLSYVVITPEIYSFGNIIGDLQ